MMSVSDINGLYSNLETESCFQHDAIRHVASAIGALQEYFLKPGDKNGMAFALRQCNRSISILIASSENDNGETAHPSVALISCVLFTVFEALSTYTNRQHGNSNNLAATWSLNLTEIDLVAQSALVLDHC
jgi:hypothetical protein